MALAMELAELGGCIGCGFFIKFVSNQKALVIFCATVCAGTIVFWISMNSKIENPDTPNGWAFPVLLFIMYLGIVSAFDMMYLLVKDLFPPSILSTCYGICNMGARAITILAPQVANFSHPWP